jgi:hypothetical protein
MTKNVKIVLLRTHVEFQLLTQALDYARKYRKRPLYPNYLERSGSKDCYTYEHFRDLWDTLRTLEYNRKFSFSATEETAIQRRLAYLETEISSCFVPAFYPQLTFSIFDYRDPDCLKRALKYVSACYGRRLSRRDELELANADFHLMSEKRNQAAQKAA